jgi:hypothetical protein
VLAWVCWSAKFQIGIQTFFTEQKSVIAWVCWSASSFRSEFKLFSRNKNRCLLGSVGQQVSDRNSNFFHGTKIGACLGLLISKHVAMAEELGSSCLCRLVGEWQLPSQVSISADPFEKNTQISS